MANLRVSHETSAIHHKMWLPWSIWHFTRSEQELHLVCTPILLSGCPYTESNALHSASTSLTLYPPSLPFPYEDYHQTGWCSSVSVTNDDFKEDYSTDIFRIHSYAILLPWWAAADVKKKLFITYRFVNFTLFLGESDENIFLFKQVKLIFCNSPPSPQNNNRFSNFFKLGVFQRD